MKLSHSRKTVIAALGLLTMAGAAHGGGVEHSDGMSSKSFDDPSRWLMRFRAIQVNPDTKSTVDVIGGEVTASTQIVPELDFTYFFTDHIAAELILAVTPHDMGARDTLLGNVDLGDVWLLPPTLNLQYHFNPKGKIRPYAGAGINYTIFFGEDSGDVDTIEYDDGFGFSLQAGMDYEINEKWAFNIDVKKIYLNTDVTLVNGGVPVDADVDLDPWIVGVGLAYRF